MPAVLLWFSLAATVRLRDIMRVRGPEVQLVGYGIVVGLSWTGDTLRSRLTAQAISNMLRHFGINVPPFDLRTRNVASVMVMASVPAFAREGDRVDALVASIGDARSICGGVLVQTPLLGPDGEVYALAQGFVLPTVESPGRLGAGLSWAEWRRRSWAVGVVAGGAQVVRRPAWPSGWEGRKVEVSLELKGPLAASRVAAAINARFKGAARAISPGVLELTIPEGFKGGMVEFLSKVGEIEVEVEEPLVVLIDPKRGTVVAGGEVKVSPCAISVGELVVKVEAETTVSDLLQVLRKAGATTEELISALERLRDAGAIRARVEIAN
ncbi:MAG TPA: flagellar basal body P-ring protein FlgI [Armatimonadetes bacterium]|nr:flagellar basal body P-ring protein FlgI [Armatimonadota bacterium]